MQNSTVTQLKGDIDYNEMITVDAHTVFPEVVDKPGVKTVMMRKHRHPDCPTSNPHYQPDVELFELTMNWWFASAHPMPLGLKGHTGTGKTELPMYICDRLNEPMYIEKITTLMRMEHIEPSIDLVTDQHGNQVTQPRYSPSAYGYENGGLVLFDEVDKAGDDLSTGLFPVTEGKPWTCPSISKTLHKHPNCRIMGTANVGGEGGDELYLTCNRLDAAFRNRFAWLTAAYLKPDREMHILKEAYPQLPFDLHHKMVKTANAFRDAMLGQDRDSFDGSFTAPFSTRTTMNWGFYMITFGLNRSVKASLDFVYKGAVDRDQLDVYQGVLERIWGDELTRPLDYFIQKANASKKS